jgi:type IV secretion system protein VirB6
MGFFAEFSAWFAAVLNQYIYDNTHLLAQLLQPAIVTLGVLYVMVWGVLMLTGQIEEPLMAGLKRIAMLGFVFAVALSLWLYDEFIVEIFFRAPAQLAGAVVGNFDSVETVDAILFAGDDVASLLMEKGGLIEGLSYKLFGLLVYIAVGLTAVYTMFLFALSRVALSVLLALGPLFIALAFFKSTQRFIEAWLAQLANYAFVTILTVLIAALMLVLLRTAAEQAVSAGGGITIAHAVRLCLAAVFVLLCMRQVLPMAAGLASGVALSTHNLLSSAIRTASGALGSFARGAVMDRETTRWDSLSRKAGYYGRQATWGLMKLPFTAGAAVARRMRRNSIRGV